MSSSAPASSRARPRVEDSDADDDNNERVQADDNDQDDEEADSDIEVAEAVTGSARAKVRHSDVVTASGGSRRDVDGDDGSVAATPEAGKNKKRRLVNGSAVRTAREDDDENDAGEERSALQDLERDADPPKPIRQKLMRDPKDGYVMGSITRIKCHNFLTYTEMECRPGPNLNMIFGPNGSGKSSLSAAIAIGLDFQAKIMDTHKNLAGFVQRGKNEGWVEIELKGRPGRPNTVFRRYINRSDNRSTCEINGKQATHKEVAETVKALHVNVDNLCSFLPQMRVQAFARMTGVELFKETLRTSDPGLLVIQERLAEAKQEVTKGDKDTEKHKSELGDKEKRLHGMEKDVKKHKEKQKIEYEVRLLDVLKPYAEYTNAKALFEVAREQKKEAKARFDEVEASNEPLQKQRDALKYFCENAARRRKAIGETRSRIHAAGNHAVAALAKHEQSVEAGREKIKELKDVEAKRKEEIVDMQKKIIGLEKMTADEPDEFPSEDLNRMREIAAQMRACGEQVTAIRDQINDCQGKIDEVHRVRDTAERGLAALNDVRKRREDLCQKEDLDLWQSINWLRNNDSKFAETVYEPARISVNVKERRFAKFAEAAINYTTLKTFITTNRSDYRMLADSLSRAGSRNSGDLRQNIVELPKEKRSLSNYPAPCSLDELRHLGFDCFAIDLLEGPEVVLAYLCETLGLHMLPIAFDKGERIRHDDIIGRPGFRRYVTAESTTTFTQARYGARGWTTQDIPLRDARIFVETVDTQRKTELERELEEAKRKSQQISDERDAVTLSEVPIREQHALLKTQRAALDDKRKEAEQRRIEYAKKLSALRNARERLAHVRSLPSVDSERQRIAVEQQQLVNERLEIARKLAKLSEQMLKIQAAETKVVLAALQAATDMQSLDKAVSEANEGYKQAEKELTEATKKMAALKEQAMAKHAEAKELEDKIPSDIKDEFDTRVGDIAAEGTVDEISQKIEDLREQLASIANVNPRIVQEYERLKREVRDLQDELEREQRSTKKAKATIERQHGKWYPLVKDVVDAVNGHFSTAFNSLGCLGEVSIAEDEDYNKWAIRIKVSFRDGERVQELKSTRQSGGERSLTTMTYLISLLETSKVPFSLVDEINQGLDARAERAVHNHIVDVVCNAEDVGQYFLITPKLLTNLNYHRKMRILCVNNSEWLPEKLPLQKIIARKLAEKQRNRA